MRPPPLLAKGVIRPRDDKTRREIGAQELEELLRRRQQPLDDPVAGGRPFRDAQQAFDLGLGRGKATVWTCDLTKAYVEINGDYRS